MQSRSWKKDWNRAKRADEIEFATIERNEAAISSFDVCASDERNVLAQCLASPVEELQLLAVTQKIDIACIHVDCIHQASLIRCPQVPLEGFNGDFPVCVVGKK